MKNIFFSLLISLILIVGAFNLPAHYLDVSRFYQSDVFGGLSLTDISGGTSVSAYPTIQNANNTALETVIDTITGTTTNSTITTLSGLTSVGTITTGTWNATAISVAKGGTGTTTPSSNQVILGDGASGFKVVNGLGSSGQFLTSAGAGSPPTWTTSAIDLALNYSWTGSNLFKNLHASSTAANPITLNGISFNTPSTQGASSTVLMNNGSGTLGWYQPQWELLGESVVTTTTGTTSVGFSATTTAGTHSKLRIIVDNRENTVADTPVYLRFNGDGTTNYGWEIYTGVITGVSTRYGKAVATSSLIYFSSAGNGSKFYSVIEVNNVPTIIKGGTINTIEMQGGGTTNVVSMLGALIWNNTSDTITTVSITTGIASSNLGIGTRLQVYGSRD